MSTQQEKLKGIADAIREKKGTADKIFANDFATEIRNLPSGGVIEPIISVTPTEARQEIRPSEGYDGIAGVDVEAIPTPEPSEFYLRKLVLTQDNGYQWELVPIKAGQVVDLKGADVEASTGWGESYHSLSHPAMTFQEWATDLEVVDDTITVPTDLSRDLEVRAYYFTADGLNWQINYDPISAYTATSDSNATFTPLAYATSLWKNNESVYYRPLTIVSLVEYHQFPMGITSINSLYARNAFEIDDIYIPDGVITIGAEAFRYCSNLKRVRIPNSVEFVQHEAFQGCSALRHIEFGENIKQLYNYAVDATYLQTCVIKALVPPIITPSCFRSAICVFLVPEESLSLYIDATNWSVFGAAGRILPNTAENRAKFGVK